MNSFKITFLNGDHLITSFNGSYSAAVQYYLGRFYNMRKCIKIEQIFTCKFNGRKIGAIGAFENFEIDVCAASKSAASNKIYETHEHIIDLVIEE